MRFRKEPIHIYILNEPEGIPLLKKPDPTDGHVASAIATGESERAFECSELGRVELRASIYPGCGFIGLKVNGDSTAAAELVWEPFATRNAWEGINEFHEKISNGNTCACPAPPQKYPWLAISFLHPVFERLTPDQRRIAILLLWGRAYFIRELGWAMVFLN